MEWLRATWYRAALPSFLNLYFVNHLQDHYGFFSTSIAHGHAGSQEASTKSLSAKSSPKSSPYTSKKKPHSGPFQAESCMFHNAFRIYLPKSFL